MKRKKLLVIGGAVVIVGIFLGVFAYRHLTSAKHTEIPLYPTIYMTGSSGEISSIDPLVTAVTKNPATHAQRGLQIMVSTNNKLIVTGKITKANHYPTIEVGMQSGTNNSVKIEAAIKAVIDYLQKNYHITQYNFLGYSAGGGGDLRYFIDYSKNKNEPQVKKWISLDGQFNASTPLQQGETLNDVLKNGPEKKTKYYVFWEENYKKVNPAIKVALLAANYKNSNETDGVVPWADTFSIYPLLKANGNDVTRYTYDGNETDTYHANVATNPNAQKYVEKFFY